jgi:MFS family permease
MAEALKDTNFQVSEKKGDDASNEVLSVMDNAKISFFHFKAVVVAGAGFFTDSYDLFSIGLLTRIIGRIYYQDDPVGYGDYVGPGVLPINLDAAVSGVALCGTLAGQVFFGHLGDRFGRKSIYGVVLAIMIIAAICQSMSFGRNARAVVGTLCWWRFFLGFGIGGDYPLSATIMSEYSSRLSRGAFVSAVFAQQGTGILTAAAVSIIVTECFRAFFPAGPYPDKQLVLATIPPGGLASLSGGLSKTSTCPTYMMLNSAGQIVYGNTMVLATEVAAIAYTALGAIVSNNPSISAISTGAVTFCNPLLFANKTVVCPFKIAGAGPFTVSLTNPYAPVNTASAVTAAGWVPQQGQLALVKTPASVNAATNVTIPPVYYAAADVGSNWGYGINANALASGYDKSTAGNALTIALSGCVNFIKYDSNGLPHVNQETGAPKTLDWPQLNAVSQAYYMKLIAYSTPPQCDWVWRIVLLFGFFPASCTMYIRATFPETPRFTLHVQGDKEKMAKDMGGVVGKELDSEHTVQAGDKISFGTFLSRHGKELLGCAMSWFLLDVAFYSQNLFQKDVFTNINWIPGGSAMNALVETFKVARAQGLIALGSTIPGYWFTVATVDTMGRLKIQLMGFVLMTTFMSALAGGYFHLLDRTTSQNTFSPSKGVQGFVVMYALTFFFANWGPNATTFVIPAELFPTTWKSTGHGFSAACGKAGAIIGAFGFLFASKPLPGEVTWQPNYGGPSWWSWVRKPNCPGGLGSKSFAGNGWDPATPLIWGKCQIHPNKQYYNGTQQYRVVGPTNAAGTVCAAGIPGCNDPWGYDVSGYPMWYVNSSGSPWGWSGPRYALGQVSGAGGLLAELGAAPGQTIAGTGQYVTPTSNQVNNMVYASSLLTSVTANVLFNGALMAINSTVLNSVYGVETVVPYAAIEANTLQHTNGALVCGDLCTYNAHLGYARPDVTTALGPTYNNFLYDFNPSAPLYPASGYSGYNLGSKIAGWVNASGITQWQPTNAGGGSVANNFTYGQFIADIYSSPSLPRPVAGVFPYGAGLQGALGVLAATNFLGMLFTFLLPETNGKTLEELNGETGAA